MALLTRKEAFLFSFSPISFSFFREIFCHHGKARDNNTYFGFTKGSGILSPNKIKVFWKEWKSILGILVKSAISRVELNFDWNCRSFLWVPLFHLNRTKFHIFSLYKNWSYHNYSIYISYGYLSTVTDCVRSSNTWRFTILSSRDRKRLVIFQILKIFSQSSSSSSN